MIVVYNARGEIQYNVDDPYVKEIYDTYEAMSDADPAFNYIVTETVSITGMYVDAEGFMTQRPVMVFDVPTSVAVGAEIVAQGLPDGVSMWIDGEAIEIPSEGPLRFTADEPGRYEIMLECWPYLPLQHELEVVA